MSDLSGIRGIIFDCDGTLADTMPSHYEAWIAIQTGEVDSALIYGFSKGSLGDIAEIMAM